MLGVSFDVYSICSMYPAASTFAPISKLGPLPSKNRRCAPDKRYLFRMIRVFYLKFLKVQIALALVKIVRYKLYNKYRSKTNL